MQRKRSEVDQMDRQQKRIKYVAASSIEMPKLHGLNFNDWWHSQEVAALLLSRNDFFVSDALAHPIHKLILQVAAVEVCLKNRINLKDPTTFIDNNFISSIKNYLPGYFINLGIGDANAVNAQDSKGDTALHYVSKYLLYFRSEMARFLVNERHADFNIKNNEGISPKEYAMLNANNPVSQVFNAGEDLAANIWSFNINLHELNLMKETYLAHKNIKKINEKFLPVILELCPKATHVQVALFLENYLSADECLPNRFQLLIQLTDPAHWITCDCYVENKTFHVFLIDSTATPAYENTYENLFATFAKAFIDSDMSPLFYILNPTLQLQHDGVSCPFFAFEHAKLAAKSDHWNYFFNTDYKNDEHLKKSMSKQETITCLHPHEEESYAVTINRLFLNNLNETPLCLGWLFRMIQSKKNLNLSADLMQSTLPNSSVTLQQYWDKRLVHEYRCGNLFKPYNKALGHKALKLAKRCEL